MPEKEIIIEIAIERLRDFPGSPFKVTMDEPMSDLIESIQTYGILIPLIIRPMRWSPDTAECTCRSCSDWNGFPPSSVR